MLYLRELHVLKDVRRGPPSPRVAAHGRGRRLRSLAARIEAENKEFYDFHEFIPSPHPRLTTRFTRSSCAGCLCLRQFRRPGRGVAPQVRRLRSISRNSGVILHLLMQRQWPCKFLVLAALSGMWGVPRTHWLAQLLPVEV